MTCVIAVSGKGGTGKTTFSALLVDSLLSQGLGPVLAVDADPNSNLDMVLGVELTSTVGEIREEMTEKVQKQELPAGMSKQDMLEIQIEQALVEAADFDLLSMGRQEGPGCYCAINNMLRVFLDRLEKRYRFGVVDNEAGMEHLSRRTTRGADLMFVMSDPTARGIETAARIAALAEKMKLEIKKKYLVVSRCMPQLDADLEDLIGGTGIELAGLVPEDPEVARLDQAGRSLRELPPSSGSRQAVGEILSGVIQGVCG